MLTIYEDKKYVAKEDRNRVVDCIYTYFRDNFYGKIEPNEKDKEYMLEIDHVKYKGNKKLDNRLGTTIETLSNGCKALMIMNHYEELGNPILNLNTCILHNRCKRRYKETVCFGTRNTEMVLYYMWQYNEISYICDELFEFPDEDNSEKDSCYMYINEKGAYIKEFEGIQY